MAADPFSQNDNAIVTREIEVTPGVCTGGPRSRVYGVQSSADGKGSTQTSGISTGDGGVHSVRAGLRYGDFMVDSELVHLLNHLEIEDFMRMVFPSEMGVTAVSCDFAQSGTQLDGSTGPVITTATPSAFNPLLNAVGCVAEFSGGALNAANLWPRAIKDVSATQIDIFPNWTGGGAGKFGEPLFTQSAVATTIRVGKPIRDMPVAGTRSVNFETQYPDQTGGASFTMVRGCRAGTFKFSWDGKGVVKISIGYSGMDFDEGTATQGNGTVTANPGKGNPIINSANDLIYFVVGGFNLLQGEVITTFSMDGNANAQGVDDVNGSLSRDGVTVGDIVFTGSMKLLHGRARTALLTALGKSGDLTDIAFKLRDPKGNSYWGRIPAVLVEASLVKTGAKNSRTDGTWNFSAQLGENDQRTFILQTLAA